MIRVKKLSVRTSVWSIVGALCIAVGAIAIVSFPSAFPERTLAISQLVIPFLEQLTLPIKEARLAMQPPDTSLPMPVYGVRVASVSDTWHAPRGADRQHEGQDIFAAKGTPVFSSTYGYVRRIGISELGGNYVYVTGAGGRRYYYAHLDTVADGLAVGQEVTKDTVIGFIGNTGNAATTPPHLHFGVYEMRKAMNPLPLLIDR